MQQVRLLSVPRLYTENVELWVLEDCCSPEPFKIGDNSVQDICELAARRCYKSFAPECNANLTKVRTDKKEFFLNILKSGHGSVLEHAQVTFAFEGVSRVFTHELVRHRVGIAISQESMRYVRTADGSFDMWLPSCIAENEDATKIFRALKQQMEASQGLFNILFDIDNQDMQRKKELTSAFRRLLPIGIATGIVWSANMRTLRHVIRMRTSLAAEEEIRIVFDKVAKICVAEWPLIFQDFSCDNGVWTSEYPT